MITEELLTLPPYISHQGIEFEMQIINNGGSEIRLCYAIGSVDAASPHKAFYDEWGSWLNTFNGPADPPTQGFLVLYENIESDVDLIWAIRDCWHWLSVNGLLH